VIIGGQVVLVRGEPRLTRDVDVTLGAGLERLEDLVALAGRAGFELLADPAEFTRRTLVLPCRDPATTLRIDFILSFSPYEAEAIRRGDPIPMAGTPVRIATAEDLVIHKMIAGRPRDIEDVKGVLRKSRQLGAGDALDGFAHLREGDVERDGGGVGPGVLPLHPRAEVAGGERLHHAVISPSGAATASRSAFMLETTAGEGAAVTAPRRTPPERSRRAGPRFQLSR
jgi:hypothetical protein